MPPRYAYWTIILEGKPTAFRAHTRDELVPTFRQLLARHPDTVLMWFARGRLWPSQEQEREDAAQRRAATTRRGAEWRPGGAHRDPRDRFKVGRDEKRRRFAAKLRRDRMEGRPPGEGRPGEGRPTASADRRPPSFGKRPHGLRSHRPPSAHHDRPPTSHGGRPPSARGDRSRGPRPNDRPHGGSGSPGGGRRPGGPRDRRNPRGGGGGGSSR